MASPGLVRIHRWVALAVGGFIVLAGLTGAGLVFRDELTPVFTPAAKVPAVPAGPGAYERILRAARLAEPRAGSFDIAISPRADRAAEVIVRRARNDRHLFVDPRDGSVVADSDREWLPFATLYQLHRRLLLGKPGEFAVGIVGLALAFLALSGVVMWWPRKAAYAFRIRWKGDRLAVSYDVHKAIGAAFALILLVNATIGFMMAFDGPSVALVNRVSGSSAPAPVPSASSNALAAGRPLDDIVAAAERALPEGTVRRISIREGHSPVVVRKRLPGDQLTNGMNRIYVDAASATVLQVRLQRDMPPGNAMFEWLFPLHSGTLVGTPYRLLLVIAGCIPLLSLVTGLIVWRSRAKRRKPAHAAAARAMPGKSLDGAQ
jgi:uncharacterized iron-regulated membrane protein